MSAAERGLLAEEVEALRDWWDGEQEGDSAGSMLGRLDAVVEQIVTARIADFKAQAVAAIEAQRDLTERVGRLPETFRDCHIDGLTTAARIVANLTPQSPPAAANDLPATGEPAEGERA